LLRAIIHDDAQRPGPANSTAAPSEARHHAMGRMMPGPFVEGHIAFMKAELKITPAQGRSPQRR
jgi:hypothetical protein